MPLAEKFLRVVWNKQPGGEAYVFTSVKDWTTEEWTEHEMDGNDPKPPTLRDLYFAPNTYSKPARRKIHCLPGRWLYADLDEVDPAGLELKPTVAWETSPGRWQCMWLLERPLKPAILGKLNQKLTYFSGADRGGWSLTKVLRVPGSYSTKHGSRHDVNLLWSNGPVYEAAVLWDLIKVTKTPGDFDKKLPQLSLTSIGEMSARQLLDDAIVKPATRKLALAESTGGQDRSAALWKLERELIEQGMSAEAAFIVCRESVWNKYRGQGRENKQIWTEIQRAVNEQVPTNERPSSNGKGKRTSSARRTRSKNSSEDKGGKNSERRRRSMTLEQFMGRDIRKPTWMVEGIWSESAHGVLAGPPKTYKSVLSTDLAVSVASGTKFLDHFPVPQTGPVILIQKENDEGEVHDRFARILHSRGLMGSASLSRGSLTYTRDNLPPVHIFDTDFDLTDPTDLRFLRAQCRKLNPVLVVLDPLYLLVPGVDENSAHEMTPVLERLLRIKQNYNAGTLIIHHFKKANEANPTKSMVERISGTGVFGRWYESALLLDKPDEEENGIRMIPVHRGHPAGGVIWAEFDLGSEFDYHYSVDIESKKERAAKEYDELRKALDDNGGKATFRMLEDILGLKRHAIERKVEQAEGIEMQKARLGGRLQQIVVHTNGNGKH